MQKTLQRLTSVVAGRTRLPARVQAVIARQETQSENLVAWAQTVIGLTWTALYAAAPKTFSAEMTFAPVPFALTLYLAFCFLRLVLLHRGVAPAWFLSLAVVFDMSLLMGLIWTFHLQYEQPAAFYLKAPTLLYVFIFIALRALRFSPYYVVLAGAAAAVGWLLLLQYALITSTAPNMGVTRDYVAYMTSASILIGAEFDKIIAILLTTGVLAVAIVRARRLLVASVVEEAAHRDLGRFFAPEIARQITSAEHSIEPGEGEIREAAILMCDVRGFTQIAMRTPPPVLMALLAEYQARMTAVIQRHGGSIDKFMGDGILATFGAALRTETFAADALTAIADLVAESRAWARERRTRGEEPLRIGFAAVAGRVVFGAVGGSERLEFTVIGDPVNLAAKIEKHNKIEGVAALTTMETLSLAEQQGYRPVQPHDARHGVVVEGIAQPMDLVVLAA